MTKAASINPANIPDTQKTNTNSNGFAALIHVTSSRYVKREYSPESNIQPRVAIKWVMGTTKGNSFERTWSVGVNWDDNLVSPDGKQFYGTINKNSDAHYFLQKVVATDYPTEKMTDDISVFENETFFMTEDTNPKVRGARRNLYPKQYHPEGWDQALAAALARRAEREAAENAKTYASADSATYQGSTTHTPVVQASTQVLKAAADALVAVLNENGGTIMRGNILAKLNPYLTTQGWSADFQRDVRIALFDMPQLQAVVSNTPSLKIDGETVSFR